MSVAAIMGVGARAGDTAFGRFLLFMLVKCNVRFKLQSDP